MAKPPSPDSEQDEPFQGGECLTAAEILAREEHSESCRLVDVVESMEYTFEVFPTVSHFGENGEEQLEPDYESPLLAFTTSQSSEGFIKTSRPETKWDAPLTASNVCSRPVLKATFECCTEDFVDWFEPPEGAPFRIFALVLTGRMRQWPKVEVDSFRNVVSYFCPIDRALTKRDVQMGPSVSQPGEDVEIRLASGRKFHRMDSGMWIWPGLLRQRFVFSVVAKGMSLVGRTILADLSPSAAGDVSLTLPDQLQSLTELDLDFKANATTTTTFGNEMNAFCMDMGKFFDKLTRMRDEGGNLISAEPVLNDMKNTLCDVLKRISKEKSTPAHMRPRGKKRGPYKKRNKKLSDESDTKRKYTPGSENTDTSWSANMTSSCSGSLSASPLDWLSPSIPPPAFGAPPPAQQTTSAMEEVLDPLDPRSLPPMPEMRPWRSPQGKNSNLTPRNDLTPEKNDLRVSPLASGGMPKLTQRFSGGVYFDCPSSGRRFSPGLSVEIPITPERLGYSVPQIDISPEASFRFSGFSPSPRTSVGLWDSDPSFPRGPGTPMYLSGLGSSHGSIPGSAMTMPVDEGSAEEAVLAQKDQIPADVTTVGGPNPAERPGGGEEGAHCPGPGESPSFTWRQKMNDIDTQLSDFNTAFDEMLGTCPFSLKLD